MKGDCQRALLLWLLLCRWYNSYGFELRTELEYPGWEASFHPSKQALKVLEVVRQKRSNVGINRVVVKMTQADIMLTATEAVDGTADGLVMLADALLAFNSSSATKLLFELRGMREDEMKQETMNRFLTTLLAEGPDQPLPLWTRFKLFCRVSKRARWASLRRTLDMTTPPPNMENENIDDVEDQQRRRRRALVSLLRSLAVPGELPGQLHRRPAIVVLENIARKEQASASRRDRREDMTKRRPAELETPKYTILAQRPAGYEIRQYEPFAVCSVDMNKPRPIDAYRTDATVSDPKMGSARAFGALAGYLFGKNEQQSAMKMTTPVLTDGRGGGDGVEKQMSFVLPSEFWSEASFSLAPKPLETSGVRLERREGGNRAMMMFGGYASKKEVEKRTKELINALNKDKDWQIDEIEPPALAQYNDPFTPPWKRLNEVSVAVKPRFEP